MGFHIPDSPRSRACSSSSTHRSAQTMTISVGTSMAEEDVNSLPPPPQTIIRPRRRNAIIPLLAAAAMAAQNPDGVAPTDPVLALAQFQDELRRRGILPPQDQAPKAPTTSLSSETGW